MIDLILLLCIVYVTSILTYDIYKDYKKDHAINKLRLVGLAICLFYTLRHLYRILIN